MRLQVKVKKIPFLKLNFIALGAFRIQRGRLDTSLEISKVQNLQL